LSGEEALVMKGMAKALWQRIIDEEAPGKKQYGARQAQANDLAA
jgi:hypothetical protein